MITKFKNESIKNSVKTFYSKTDSLRSYLKLSLSVKLSLKKQLIWTTFFDVLKFRNILDSVPPKDPNDII